MRYRITGLWLIWIFLLTGCGMIPKEEGELLPPIITPKEIPYRTLVVTPEAIEKQVTVRGYIVPAVIENLYYTEKGGRIKSFNVQAGDHVKKGDVLMELVVDNLPDTIEQQKISLKNLRDDYETSLKIWDLEQKQDLIAIESQKTTLEKMEANPDLYTGEELEREHHNLLNLNLALDIKKLTRENGLDQKLSAIRLEELRLKKNEETLEKSRIRASMDGVITYVKRGFVGDLVNDYETLISLADTTIMHVTYEGKQAFEFKIGMPVAFTYRRGAYSGTVVQTPDSVPLEERELFVNTAVFTFEELPPTYVIGEPIEVRATLERSEDSLILPKGAIKTFGTDKLVYVLDEGEKRERFVTLGIDNGQFVQVLTGLEAGDEVILN